MYPFYYPTTLMIIDDDPILLQTYTFLFSDFFLCKTYPDPLEALTFMKAEDQKKMDLGDFIAPYPDIYHLESLKEGDLFLKLTTSKLSSVLENSKRFSQVSVAIIDYELPTMNGLELCYEMKKLNLPIRKIMLTGQASQQQAIQAFNENLIDCFFAKNEQNLTDRLLREIKAQQQKYFLSLTEPLKLAFSLQDTAFLKDPVVEQAIFAILEKHQIEEYYLNTHPPGFFMFQENGTPYFLMIYSKDRMRAHFEIAEDNDAPQDLLNCLSSCEKVPLFPTQSGYYEPFIKKIWRNYLWPAQHIKGQTDWYLGVIINEKFLYESLKAYVSLETYKAIL